MESCRVTFSIPPDFICEHKSRCLGLSGRSLVSNSHVSFFFRGEDDLMLSLPSSRDETAGHDEWCGRCSTFFTLLTYLISIDRCCGRSATVFYLAAYGYNLTLSAALLRVFSRRRVQCT